MVARSSTAEAAPLTAAFAEEAREAGLRYSNDARPGIGRETRGKNVVYLSSTGVLVKDADTLARIRRLAISPAWQNVWICPYENGHIQATGRDARERKQYRYHADWRQRRDDNKFGRMRGRACVTDGSRFRSTDASASGNFSAISNPSRAGAVATRRKSKPSTRPKSNSHRQTLSPCISTGNRSAPPR